MIDLDYSLDTARARQLGLVVLQSDESIERDMYRLMPDTAELLVTRVPSGAHVTPESLAEMEGHLAQAAGLFPHGAQLDVVGYGCTSGTAQIGANRVAAAVRQGVPTPEVTEPVTSAIAACGLLDVRRLGLISPYVHSVSRRLIDVFSQSGLSVDAFASFNQSEEQQVARISQASVIAAARKVAASAQLDALFISCTNLRVLDCIAAIEAETGLPVLSSNQVLAWHMLTLAGIPTQGSVPGALGALG